MTVNPPDSLPKYLVEGLPKQDTETLEDVKAYVEALLEERTRPIEEAELPEAAEPVDGPADGPDGERAGGRGTVVKEKVRCGDDTCKCASGNPEEMHGPYLYRYYREDGTMKSEYVGKP